MVKLKYELRLGDFVANFAIEEWNGETYQSFGQWRKSHLILIGSRKDICRQLHQGATVEILWFCPLVIFSLSFFACTDGHLSQREREREHLFCNACKSCIGKWKKLKGICYYVPPAVTQSVGMFFSLSWHDYDSCLHHSFSILRPSVRPRGIVI